MQYTNRALFIARGAVVNSVIIGSHIANSGTVEVPGNVAIARLRVHDGCLSDAQVFANYVTEGSFTGMVPSPSSTPSNSPTPSNTPSSSSTPSNTASLT